MTGRFLRDEPCLVKGYGMLGDATNSDRPTKDAAMTIIDFLAVSGAMAWLFIAWRSYRYAADALTRLRWALWGYRKRHKRAT